MTKREVVQFWRVWCRQNRIKAKILHQGMVVIAADPEYWRTTGWPSLYEALKLENSISPTRH